MESMKQKQQKETSRATAQKKHTHSHTPRTKETHIDNNERMARGAPSQNTKANV